MVLKSFPLILIAVFDIKILMLYYLKVIFSNLWQNLQ